MAEALSKSGDYRVLRRLVPRTAFAATVGPDTKTGIWLDVETTGLDPRKDEVKNGRDFKAKRGRMVRSEGGLIS
jgi:hypothetical protein